MKPARVIVDRDVKPANGRCSVCDRYYRLTKSGLMKLHHPNGTLCDGSLQPPRVNQQRAPGSWFAARRATLARDNHMCRKCSGKVGLEVHHIKARIDGGTNEPSNLVTLCSACHDETTYAEPPAEAMSFERWLTVIPARYLVPVFAAAWPHDKSAAAFKAELLAMFAANGIRTP